MNNTRIVIRRAFAGVLLALSATLLAAGPSSAAETFTTTYDKSSFVSTSTFQYQPTYSDLAYARYAKVGITPIPIP
jgi:hypothetical protein